MCEDAEFYINFTWTRNSLALFTQEYGSSLKLAPQIFVTQLKKTIDPTSRLCSEFQDSDGAPSPQLETCSGKHNLLQGIKRLNIRTYQLQATALPPVEDPYCACNWCLLFQEHLYRRLYGQQKKQQVLSIIIQFRLYCIAKTNLRQWEYQAFLVPSLTPWQIFAYATPNNLETKSDLQFYTNNEACIRVKKERTARRSSHIYIFYFF